MRPLKRRTFRDPAPSKWGYRLQRLLLTPGVVAGIRIGVPLILIAVIATTWFSNPRNVAVLNAKITEAKAAFEARPEFQVTGLQITGADAPLQADIHRVLPLRFPTSSFALDLEDLRRTVAALNAVSEASLRLGEGGVLQVDVTPRVPVALWRDRQTLKLLDAEGVFAGVAVTRAERSDLPLIAGLGAKDHIAEALSLFRDAAPLGDKVRGLVRVGERRWDLVLDENLRVLLPEEGARAAIDRVIVLAQTQELFDKDIVVVDMRNSARPTVRMSRDAALAMRRVSETRSVMAEEN